MIYAEIEPGILIFLLWGLLSLLSSRSKKKDTQLFNLDLKEENGVKEVDFSENSDFEFIKSNPIEKNIELIQESEISELVDTDSYSYDFKEPVPNKIELTNINSLTNKKGNNKSKIYKKLFSKKSIRNSIVTMEILNKPKALK